VSQAGPPKIKVILDNVAAGHDFPSGAAQDRRAWIEVVAYAGGNVVYQSGVVKDGTPVLANPDPDLWLFRDCIFDDAGKEVSMFWQAASFDPLALPAPVTIDPADPRYYQTHIQQTYPRTGPAIAQAPDRVTMRVRLQPIGLDVLDDLVTSGDLDPQVRSQMPTFDVGAVKLVEWTKATATDTIFDENRTPFSCVSPTALNVQAQSVPAKAHAKCAP
jgi:hypothetical protein